MKKLQIILLVAVALLLTAVLANASQINISQGGTWIGVINSYSGSLNATQNYDYSDELGYLRNDDIINGPSAVNQQGQIFFYNGPDGLSFNTVLGSVGDGPNGSVQWDISIVNSTTNPGVIVSDDPGELYENGTTNTFTADFAYYQVYGDGGIIGPIGGNTWQLTIDPASYTNISSLLAYSSTGTSIDLGLDVSKNIVFSLAVDPVPEPATVILFGLGLLSFAGVSRRKQ